MSHSLKTEAREYKLDLIWVWEVGWDKDDTEPVDNYTFFYVC